MTLCKASLMIFAIAAVAFAAPMSSKAATITYSASLDGPSESPPVASPGIGTALVFIDLVANTMEVSANFSGLIGTTTVAHIHCCTALPGVGTAGVATTTPTFPGFPAGVMAGSYENTFDMLAASSYNPAFITANGGTPATAFVAFLIGLDAGRAYFNIHSSFAGGGEIRGFLQPVPLPAALPLFATILAGGGLIAWRTKRKAAQVATN